MEPLFKLDEIYNILVIGIGSLKLGNFGFCLTDVKINKNILEKTLTIYSSILLMRPNIMVLF
jgi:hypothetical protein